MLTPHNYKNFGLYFALLGGLGACAVESAPNDKATTARSPGVTAPFDVQDVIGRIRHSYRDEGVAIVAGRPQFTYSVRATGGTVSVTPRHWISDQKAVLEGRAAREEVLEGTAVAFETTHIAREEAYDLGQGTMRVAADGSLRIDRGIAEERFVNDHRGVEQQWHFEAEPAGEGDLVVRVTTGGQSYVGQTEHGHHFVDEANDVGIRYGLATWIDDLGYRTDVPVTYEDGDLVLTVPADAVATAQYPAVLDPVVFAEFGITNPATAPSPGLEEGISIAHNTANFLVVWSDQRAGHFDIFGTRVAFDGTILDPNGIGISTADEDQVGPSVAGTSNGWLVAWSDRRNEANFDVFSTIVQNDGTVSSPDGVAVSQGAGDENEVDVGTNGVNYAVAWSDTRSGTPNVWATRVGNDGVPLNAGNAIDAGGDRQVTPAVECDGVFCLVVWTEGNTLEEQIHGARFRYSHGLPIDAPSYSVSTSTVIGTGRNLLPDIAFDGTNYLVVWQTDRSGVGFDIYGNRVVRNSTISLDNAGFAINSALSAQRAPAIAYDGTRYFVAYKDEVNDAQGDIRVSRVETDATVTDPTGFEVNGLAFVAEFPAVSARFGSAYVAWEDGRNSKDVVGTTVNGATMAIGNVFGDVLSTSGNRQISSSVAYNGSVYMVVFTDSRLSGGDDYDIIAARVTPTGLVLDPSGRGVAIAPGIQAAPDVAFSTTSNNFLIAWSDRRNGNWDVRGAVIDAATFVQGADILIAQGAADESFSTIGYNVGNDEFLVAWRDRASGNFDITAQRISGAGALQGGAIAIVGAAGNQTRPDVASDGTNWLVAWGDERAGETNADIRGAIVDQTGTVTVPDFVISGAANEQQFVRLAHDGTNYVAVWQDDRTAADQHDIFVNRIQGDGTVLDGNGNAISNDANLSEERPAIAIVDDSTVGGLTWFIVWRQEVSAVDGSFNLIGRQYLTTGAPQDVEFTISDLAGSEDQPSVASAPQDRAIVFYQRFDPAAGISVDRIRGRRVTFP